MTIQEYFGDWSTILDLTKITRNLEVLSKAKYQCCPSIKDIFKAFKLCSLHDLRVVILGQDPYPNIINGKPVATGIAFANSPDTSEKDYSPSLDILKDSVIDYTRPHGIINFDQSLEKWESQGVLLINSALSCQAGKTGSHSLMWWPFIKSLLQRLSECHTGIVYVLMGKEAQNFESYINPQFNHIIKCNHPSWYARTHTSMPSDIWEEINTILIGQNGYGIEWFTEY